MGEDEFEFCGDVYQAIEVSLSNGCKGCGIWTQSHGCAANLFAEGKVPGCDPCYRLDERNVIFVDKQ